jgi:pre-mRNA-splicing factor 18
MESLLQVMAAKKRELSALKAEAQSGKKPKYMRRAEVEDLRLEKEKQQRQEEEEERLKKAATKKRKLETPAPVAEKEKEEKEEHDEATLSYAEMKRRLRELGAPVTLFGETDRDRMARLRLAEHDAATRRADELGDGHANRNEFLDGRDDGVRDRDDDDDDDERGGSGEDKRGGALAADDAMAAHGGGDDEQDDVMIVYSFFKGMLRRWEQDLADRPDQIKRTAQGKMATKTMKQCKDYIRPLFKLCKKRDVSSDILPNLVQIVRFCKAGEFVQANDAYIKLAIGNAAWPIGVTMVGIHERTGREKINANKQAHVMNNEAQRKYITSVKRLISYAQSVANVLPSKKVN